MVSPRGVGAHHPYDMVDSITLEQALNKLKVGWYYDWHIKPRVYKGIEAVPMYWDETVIGRPVGGNSEWILGFNEPDIPGQANMSVDLGATCWSRIEQDNPNAKLVSPATSPEGHQWRWAWLNNYVARYKKDPRVDAVAVHVYPQTWGYVRETMDRAWEFAQRFGVKLWVTEYAFLPCWPKRDVSMTRMTQHFIDHPERFERWAPFIAYASGDEGWNFGKACNPSLFKERGQFTPAGEEYMATAAPDVDWADPRADVNKDGQVDILDLALVGANFKKPVKPT